MLLVAVSWRLVALRIGPVELRPLRTLGRLVPWVPRLLAVHLGASLLLLSAVRAVLDPAVTVPAFVLLAGLVEVLFALLVLPGAAPQVVALVAAVPFTASLALFGGTEVIGHLPVYGVLLALLVLGSAPATAREVWSLPVPHSA